ncbi:hypothetical protein RSP795_22285 [Ralstonia solanacearum]|nr:hypothetical protein RSP795_22285 [Ralstonia solanacearum]
MTGTLFVLPESKRFDLITMVEGQQVILKGTLSASVFRQIHGQGNNEQQPVDPRAITRTPWVVEIRTRELSERNRASRQVHSLQRLVRPEPGGN